MVKYVCMYVVREGKDKRDFKSCLKNMQIGARVGFLLKVSPMKGFV